MRGGRRIFLFLLILVLATPTAYAVNYCTQVFQVLNSGPHRSLDQIPELVIGTFNVLKFDRNKELNAISEIAAVIREKNPDILTIQEIADFDTLANFAKNHLSDKYHALMTPSEHAAGMRSGFLVKKDLALTLELKSHASETWIDPTQNGRNPELLFPRDLPTLFVRRVNDPNPESKPVMIIMGVHLKSKRDRPGDPMSAVIRKAQAERTAQIVKNYQEQYGPNVPLIVMGDFNGAVFDESEYQALNQIAQLKDAMTAESVATPALSRATHAYFPESGGAELKQIDYILVSPSTAADVLDAEVYRYKDPTTGMPKPLPTNMAERNKNPSDHFPYFVKMNFKNFLSKLNGRDPKSIIKATYFKPKSKSTPAPKKQTKQTTIRPAPGLNQEPRELQRP